MKNYKISAFFLFAILITIFSGCGGGGGGASPAPTTPSATGTLGGVAAVGTPIVNGNIAVSCAAGSTLSTSTDSSGAWSVTLYGQTLPCAVQVSGGSINGVSNTTPYQSIAINTGTVNVTPLTDLIVANLSNTATPSTWFASLTSAPTQLTAITQTQITAALTKMSTALPALTSIKTTNPITTSFTPAAGNSIDDMLSALSTAIIKTGVTYTSLLSNASMAAYSSPTTGFNSALTNAYASTSTGGNIPVAITSCSASNITISAYNAITLGMTLAQVDQTIGCAHSADSRNSQFVSYIWGIYPLLNQNLLVYSQYPVTAAIAVIFDPTASFVIALPTGQVYGFGSGLGSIISAPSFKDGYGF